MAGTVVYPNKEHHVFVKEQGQKQNAEKNVSISQPGRRDTGSPLAAYSDFFLRGSILLVLVVVVVASSSLSAESNSEMPGPVLRSENGTGTNLCPTICLLDEGDLRARHHGRPLGGPPRQ